tara:strand:+ start:762 stop:1181 length:420 start_codon:yes stop_codon:yes gene_type:complete
MWMTALPLKTIKKLNQRHLSNGKMMTRVSVNPVTAVAGAVGGIVIATITGRENQSHAREFWTFVMRDMDFFARQDRCLPTTMFTWQQNKSELTDCARVMLSRAPAGQQLGMKKTLRWCRSMKSMERSQERVGNDHFLRT